MTRGGYTVHDEIYVKVRIKMNLLNKFVKDH